MMKKTKQILGTNVADDDRDVSLICQRIYNHNAHLTTRIKNK